MKRTTLAVAAALVAGLAAGATGDHLMAAQQAQGGLTRTVLQRADVPGVVGKEVILSMSEFTPGAVSARHMHPGGELAYLVDGSVVSEIAGKPPTTIRMGTSYAQAPNVPHVARNGSASASARVVACTVVDKGQPAAVTVP
jgi:quercetin dioxygenase-like cupin family protein